jgi:RecA-family ATPase
MHNTDVGEEDVNWPESLADHVIENPVRDLLGIAIDYSQNVLGDLWIERGSYVVINGPTGVGKSVLAVQIGVEAALGRETFGIKVDRPLKVLIVQAEDSKNDRIGQFQTILKRLSPEDRQLVLQNLRIVTPRKRALRGKNLFNFLREELKTPTLIW